METSKQIKCCQKGKGENCTEKGMEVGTISTPNAWELQILLHLGHTRDKMWSRPSRALCTLPKSKPTGKGMEGGTEEGKEDGNPAAAPG